MVCATFFFLIANNQEIRKAAMAPVDCPTEITEIDSNYDASAGIYGVTQFVPKTFNLKVYRQGRRRTP